MTKNNDFPDVHYFNQLVLNLRDKPDRDVAIVGASFLDLALEMTIRTKLVGGFEKSYDGLFGGATGPASSLSGKVEIAAALARIDTQLQGECTLIRRIRNEFAHSIHDVSCETGAIADRIRSLTLSNGIPLDPFGSSWRSMEEVDDGVMVMPDGSVEPTKDLFLIVDSHRAVGFYVPMPPKGGLAPTGSQALLYSLWATIALVLAPAITPWINGGEEEEPEYEDR